MNPGSQFPDLSELRPGLELLDADKPVTTRVESVGSSFGAVVVVLFYMALAALFAGV